MPQNSAVYAVSRIRSRERTLFNRDAVKRLAASSAKEALRMLIDANYGAMPDASILDTDAMIESELERTYELVREVTTKPSLTDIFFLASDITNLKLYIKLRITGSKETPAVARGGVYEPAELKRMVENGDYKELPGAIADAMADIEADIAADRVDPAMISVKLDQSYIDHAISSGDAFIQAYFKATADFDNLITLARLSALNAPVERLKKLLLSGGDIPKELIIKHYLSPREQLSRELPAGQFKEQLKKGLEEYALSSNAMALERARDNALMRFASRGKNDIDTIAPVIGFLLAKRQEAKVIRLIMTALRNGLSEEAINERTRVLYGE